MRVRQKGFLGEVVYFCIDTTTFDFSLILYHWPKRLITHKSIQMKQSQAHDYVVSKQSQVKKQANIRLLGSNSLEITNLNLGGCDQELSNLNKNRQCI